MSVFGCGSPAGKPQLILSFLFCFLFQIRLVRSLWSGMQLRELAEFFPCLHKFFRVNLIECHASHRLLTDHQLFTVHALGTILDLILPVLHEL